VLLLAVNAIAFDSASRFSRSKICPDDWPLEDKAPFRDCPDPHTVFGY
jgi:hypothetical protein